MTTCHIRLVLIVGPQSGNSAEAPVSRFRALVEHCDCPFAHSVIHKSTLPARSPLILITPNCCKVKEIWAEAMVTAIPAEKGERFLTRLRDFFGTALTWASRGRHRLHIGCYLFRFDPTA